MKGLLLALGFAPVLLPAVPCRTQEAAALLSSREFALARNILEACAEADPADPRVFLYLGQLSLATHDDTRAVKFFERAVALEPGNGEFELWLGRAYGQKAIHASVFEQPSLAVKVRKAFERSVQLDPDNLEARVAMLEYLLRAPEFLGGSPERAREQAAAIRSRDRLKGFRAYGRIAEHEKHFDRAEQEYDSAAREFPDRPEPFYWRASLAAHRKDYARAFSILESLLASQPGELSACYEFAQIAIASGERLDRGEECLKAYLQREPGSDDPSPAVAHFRLGALYERKKKRDLARREYEEALRLEPSLTDARRQLAKFPR